MIDDETIEACNGLNDTTGNASVHYNFPKGSFQWAIEQMKNGEQVRRKRWDHDGYVFMDRLGMLTHSNGSRLNSWIGVIEATDWCIFKDEFCLSDKKLTNAIKDKFGIEVIGKQ